MAVVDAGGAVRRRPRLVGGDAGHSAAGAQAGRPRLQRPRPRPAAGADPRRDRDRPPRDATLARAPPFAVAESLTPLLSTVLKTCRPPPPARRPRPSGRRLLSLRSRGLRRCDLRRTRAAVHRTGPAAGAVVDDRRSGIAGMAWSRTYLQVHWLSDVVAGSLLGVGISLAVFAGAEWSTAGRRSAADYGLISPSGSVAGS